MAARLTVPQLAPAALVGVICLAVGVLAGIDPRLAVFAALGLAFVLITFSNLALGLVILIVVVFTETTPIAGPALSFTKLTGLLLAVAWLARLAVQPQGSERVLISEHPMVSYAIAAFLGWAAISAAWADVVAAAFDASLALLLVAALYVIVYTAVGTRREAIWVLGAFVGGTALSALYGLAVRPELSTVEAGRLASTIKDPNFLAASLVAGLALAIGGFVAARGHLLTRIATLAAASACLAAFLLTGSRGGIVALAVALVAGVIVAGRWRAGAVLAAAAIAGGGVGYYTVYAPPEIRDRIGAATQGETEEEGRITIWTVGWRMVEDNPVRGVGVGQFREESIHYVLEPGTVFRTDRVIDTPPYAHNTYLGVLAELGVVGLALFLAIVAFSVWAAYAAAHRFRSDGDWRMEIMARALLVALAGVLAADFFISAESSKVTWLLLALGPALLGVARRGRSQDD